MTEPLLSAALIDELEEVAQEVASGAADVLREYSDRPLEQVTTKSSPTDLVSEADRASEAFIVSRLRQARPSDSVHSEEGTYGPDVILNPSDSLEPGMQVRVAKPAKEARSTKDAKGGRERRR